MEAKEPSTPSQLLSKLLKSPWTLPIAASVALVIPCFWQPIVSAVDVQSHLYNAWLGELINRGVIHGLWVGYQSTNVLIDMILPWLIRCFGVSGAERIVTSVLVLVFFWGAFHFISAVRGHTAYWLAPWLAILSYGYVFQLGLLNYYLSCGIVFWLLAIAWRQRFGWRALWAAPFLILAWLAHPLPVLWFLSVATYCWLARRVQVRIQALLFLGCVAAVFLVRSYVVARYLSFWTHTQLRLWTGIDQSLLHGWPYLPVGLGFLLFSAVLLGEPENRWRAMVSVPAQAYFLTAVAIIAIPTAIRVSMYGAAAGAIAERLSLLSGVLLLAVLSRSIYRRWYLAAGLLTAAIFFGALYYDIGTKARVEAKMEKLVETLPAGERVISFADLPDDDERGNGSMSGGKLTHLTEWVLTHLVGGLQGNHLLSRACIGHCFDYANYEPSTGQFRVHALPGNPVVLASNAEVGTVESGTYVAKTGDLPLYALIRCGPAPGDIIMEPMTVGESRSTLACPGTRSDSGK
jgi:hypothetical protein